MSLHFSFFLSGDGIFGAYQHLKYVLCAIPEKNPSGLPVARKSLPGTVAVLPQGRAIRSPGAQQKRKPMGN